LLRDHRPYWLKKLDLNFRAWYVEHFIRPQLEYLGPDYTFMKPWHVDIFGGPVRIGRCANIITTDDYKVRFTIWQAAEGLGSITVGDCCLICPGVRISSAVSIKIGDGVMLASGAYITDSDWHGTYDRIGMEDKYAPVVLEDNVWIGDNAIVCKGVTVGKNSIVAARAVVVKDVPPNTVVAGNPAKVVRHLDTKHPQVTRQDWFADIDALNKQIDDLDLGMLAGNTLLGWLRSVILPRKGD